MTLRDIFENLVLVSRDMWQAEKQVSCLDAIQAILAKAGFTYLSQGCYSEAWKSDQWGGIVVKFSKDESGVNYPDLERCPHLRPYWLKPLFKSEFVCIQPLADTSRPSDARDEIFSELGIDEGQDEYYDMHYGNVGHYRGRAIAFDMMT